MRLLTFGFWVVLPIVGLLAVLLSLTRISNQIGNKPAGIPGSYTVDSRSCAGGLCLPIGTFTSSDGLVVQRDLAGDSRWANGTHRVVYDPSSTSVIVPLPGSWDPTAQITTLAGGVGVLLLWGWTLRGARRRPPAAQPRSSLT